MTNSVRRNITTKLCIIALSIAISGCSSTDYYAVKSSFAVKKHNENQVPEIVSTDAFKEKKGKIKRVAVRAPDGCANETASENNEKGTIGRTLLKSNCGHEMAMLERSLAKANYTVISWKVIQSRAYSSQRAALDIAKEMKADILLQINSMERLIDGQSEDLPWERQFYKSNKNWHIKKPAKVENHIKNQIVAHAKRIEGQIQVGQASVNLNVTVADVHSGEAIWFYEFTLGNEGEDELITTTSYSSCSYNYCAEYMPSPMRRNRPDKRSERGRNRPVERLYSSSIQEEGPTVLVDKQRETHNKLIKLLVANMTDNLLNY
ncbi:MAG: hypothetical protein ACI9UT_002251 [Flavobacteriales bacterium]|jgi:hypothetical protein